jgi:hypothetical protein
MRRSQNPAGILYFQLEAANEKSYNRTTNLFGSLSELKRRMLRISDVNFKILRDAPRAKK